jgi:hypothetical protein
VRPRRCRSDTRIGQNRMTEIRMSLWDTRIGQIRMTEIRMSL